MRVAVIGRGNIGGTLGAALSRAGHEVVYGVREPTAAGEAPIAEALQAADTVLRRVDGRLAGRTARAGPTGWVASRRRIESGRGQARPGPSHTTRHAGPHRAVRSAFPETTVGLGEPFQAHGLVPVGVGQRPLEWPGPCDTPVPLLRRRP